MTPALTTAGLALLAALQVADILTTHLILKRGGVERNVLLAGLFEEFGALPTMIVTKAALVALAWNYLPPYPFAIAAICVFYVGIVVNNLHVLHRKLPSGGTR